LTKKSGTVFVGSIERLPWAAQESLAAATLSGKSRLRLVASTVLDPRAAAEEGRISRSLIDVFAGAIVVWPSLRERMADIAVLARSFIEEVCRLNGLAPISMAPDALSALEQHAWPGNVRQLRTAIESAVILAQDGQVRLQDLPEYLRAPHGHAGQSGRADRRFRDAKRSVVEAFERAYLEDLLKRHAGNVTGAAEQSGMLRSALQRLLRKHDLHSADFRSSRATGRYAS
jgi:DNA-binding NtrC family response regulator